jgi:hypothetical protein
MEKDEILARVAVDENDISSWLLWRKDDIYTWLL